MYVLQIYGKNDSVAVKRCAASITRADIWAIAYGTRPEEWTPEEVKQKKRKKKKYTFLSDAQAQFMQDKELRRKRNSKRESFKIAHSKTDLWLSAEVKLRDVKSFQDQKEQFDLEAGT